MSTLDLFASKIRSTLYKYNNGIFQLPLEQLLKECQNELDDLGRQFSHSSTDDGKNKIREIKKAVEDKIKELREKKKSYENFYDLVARIKELEDCIIELNTILNSDIDIHFDEVIYPKFEYNGKVARVEYDGSIGSLLHELKHAFQFLNGKIDFIVQRGVVIPGITYDVTDEIEAYVRQYAYDGILRYREEIDIENSKTSFGEEAKNNFKKILDALDKNNKHLDIKEIKSMNRINIDVIVKIADSPFKNGLYKQIPRTPLDKNSTMKELKTLNINREDYEKLDRLIFKNKKAEDTKAYAKFVKIFVRKKTYIYVK